MKRFLLIGAAGYIAERHMKAIKETCGNLVCAIDRFDVMGRIDSYFPDAEFFSDFADLSAFMVGKKGVDYASICTPNYLHSEHILYSMSQGADVICEKPLVLNPCELEPLYKTEKETGKRVFNILQLRLHPVIAALKNQIDSRVASEKYDVDLTYITSRGKWYQKSWKGNANKSGGVG
ncbi:MAG: Gfo/Idh/MocA family oxidoreductase, partial [Prolixibacteraceae bacterium]|nr:Gfo/Idh/MocA family oxidoreductase [Prolixibacteraceae bacterium]